MTDVVEALERTWCCDCGVHFSIPKKLITSRRETGQALTAPTKRRWAMAARAGAKTKARGKNAKAKTATKKQRRSIGDNSGKFHAVPDETIVRAIDTLRTKKRAMKKVQEELDQLKGVYRSARKRAKNDGLNLDAFDLIESLENQDQGTVLVNHADAGRYLRLTESALATQMELFQNLEAPAPKIDVALQGQQAGKEGAPADVNPHTPGSDDFVIWHDNHKIGVKQAEAGLSGKN